MDEKLFICPKNDAEAVSIVEMIESEKKNGARVDVLVTEQGWGASWGNLETSILRNLAERVGIENEVKLKVIDELDADIKELEEKISSLDKDDEEKSVLIDKKSKIEAMRRKNADEILKNVDARNRMYTVNPTGKIFDLYGVELQGEARGAKNIDHHIYGDDDRSNPQASIEQVADVLGVDLTLEQKFIAANDKGFIPEMQRLGAELGLEGEDLQAIIDNVRMKDRMAQGITLEQEQQAKEAIDALGDLSEKRELIIMDLPHSKTATVTDRLFGKYDNLLVTCGDGETNFFGTTEIINALNEKYKEVDENGNSNCWCGGQLDKGNGYWGGTEIDQDSVKETVASEVEKSKKVDLNR